jgi:TonB family protein
MWERSLFTRRLTGLLLFVGLLGASNSWAAGNDVEKQLKSEYQGKIVTLRQPYIGERLRFGPDGKLIGSAEVGPWTVDGQLEVKSVTLKNRVLKIEARRVLLFFDPVSHQFRDILSVAEDQNMASQFHRNPERWKKIARERAEVIVELASEAPDDHDIAQVANVIFLAPGESLANAAPSFWKSYFAGPSGRTEGESTLDEPVYPVNRNGVSAPRALQAPDPSYSEVARQAGYTGHVVLSLVIDSLGNPRDIQIVTPAGLGLDEQSVEAVQHWKFEPAQKNARPVSVKINVETNFRLY